MVNRVVGLGSISAIAEIVSYMNLGLPWKRCLIAHAVAMINDSTRWESIGFFMTEFMI